MNFSPHPAAERNYYDNGANLTLNTSLNTTKLVQNEVQLSQQSIKQVPPYNNNYPNQIAYTQNQIQNEFALPTTLNRNSEYPNAKPYQQQQQYQPQAYQSEQSKQSTQADVKPTADFDFESKREILSQLQIKKPPLHVIEEVFPNFRFYKVSQTILCFEQVIIFERKEKLLCYPEHLKLICIPRHKILMCETGSQDFHEMCKKLSLRSIFIPLVAFILSIIFFSAKLSSVGYFFLILPIFRVIQFMIKMIFPCCNKNFVRIYYKGDKYSQNFQSHTQHNQLLNILQFQNTKLKCISLSLQKKPDNDFIFGYVYGCLGKNQPTIHQISHMQNDEFLDEIHYSGTIKSL